MNTPTKNAVSHLHRQIILLIEKKRLLGLDQKVRRIQRQLQLGGRV